MTKAVSAGGSTASRSSPSISTRPVDGGTMPTTWRPRITGGRLGPRACGCFLVAAQPESSANLPLPDYGRVARNPVRINAKRRGGFLQADFPLKYPLSDRVYRRPMARGKILCKGFLPTW